MENNQNGSKPVEYDKNGLPVFPQATETKLGVPVSAAGSNSTSVGIKIIVILTTIVVGCVGWYFWKVRKVAVEPIAVTKPVTDQAKALTEVSLDLSPVSVPDSQNAFFVLNQIDSKDIKEIKLDDELNVIRGQSFDAAAASKLALDNEALLEKFDQGAKQIYFQIPEYGNPQAITLNMPIIAMGGWRAGTRVYLIKAIALAHQGDSDTALAMAFNVVKLGYNIQQSQGTVLTYLVGMSIKDYGYQAIQTILPYAKSSATYKVFGPSLNQYDDNKSGLAKAFKLEYRHTLVSLKAVDKGTKSDYQATINDPNENPDLKEVLKLSLDNPRIFDEQETTQYTKDYYTRMVSAIDQSCSNRQPVTIPNLLPANKSDYATTENILGRYMMSVVEINLDSLFEKRCQEDVLLGATKILFAVEACKNDTGSLPSDLQSLVPKYISVLPQDPYNNQDYKYDSAKQVIYSVGQNKVDDGGTLGDDWTKQPDYTFKIQ